MQTHRPAQILAHTIKTLRIEEECADLLNALKPDHFGADTLHAAVAIQLRYSEWKHDENAHLTHKNCYAETPPRNTRDDVMEAIRDLAAVRKQLESVEALLPANLRDLLPFIGE